MKKLLFFICLACCIKTVSAQQVITLQTDSSAYVAKIIVPSYDNLFKLFKASSKDFDATLLALDYTKMDEKDAEAFYAKSSDKNIVYSIIKQDKEIDIAFNNHTDYPQTMKDALLKKFTDLSYKRVKGLDTYVFTLKDDNGAELTYCMMFDIHKKEGGVTLLQIE